MVLVIPTSTDPEVPDYTQRTVLDGREYLLRFLYSQRTCRWSLSISDPDGNLLAAGIRIVASWPLLRLQTDPRLPPGELYALDSVGDVGSGTPAAGTDPDLEDLGARVRLVYLDAAELGR